MDQAQSESRRRTGATFSKEERIAAALASMPKAASF